MSKLDFKSLPEPENNYKLGLKIGGGIGGEVYEAVENQTGKKVAIKIIELNKETEDEIHQEYQVLKQMSTNNNFPEFYGIYAKRGKDNALKIWLVMEFCEGGEVTTLVRKLEQENKKMSELHIAYIMRETIKAIIHLHENDVSHRDIRGSNILLTADGRVKLIDYGISKRVEKNKKIKTCVGSPSWLAPEVIACQIEEDTPGYDKKADVWAIGITAIELGDGHAPFEDIHPGRALFQIVKNPPPTLRKQSDWSQLYNDFISECLIKTPENRPFAQELLVHPFFEPLDKQENLIEDLIALLEKYKNINLYKKPDVQVRKGYMKMEDRSTMQKILQEDLAAMTKVSEDSVLFELHERLKKNEIHTFIGDILLILNPSKMLDAYGTQYHKKYRFKAKSQNAPHIYSIADSAYRDAFHHEKPQQILFAGETGAGKTVNMMHTTEHLLFLGQGLKSSEKITTALSVIHAMGNARTPHNANSTRHILQTQLTFTDTRKVSGAVFRVYLLEKERVTMKTKKQPNFHIFYYFYDAIKAENKLADYHMSEQNYKLLKTESNKEVRSGKFHSFESNLKELGFEEEQINAIKNILAAIILMGEIEFLDDEDGNGVLESPEIVTNVAHLLGVDKKKLSWALLNYCLIINGEATMRHNSKENADEAKNVLARGLYSRLVDWVVNTINEKISVCRVIYGDKHVISLLDLYGFECYKRNTLNQLFVNTINEQLQFHYNQKIFAWEKQTAAEEGIPFPNLDYNDNKMVIDLIMSKPDGLLHKIDEATRNEDETDLIESIKTAKGAPIFVNTENEFSINHYTGKLTYDASDMPAKNRDFLPPEIIDTMRLSTQEVVKQLFSSLLSKSGNLSKEAEKHGDESTTKKKEKKVNTTPSGQYSQSRQMRTAAATYKGACVDLFKNLTIQNYGYHFVRCIRTDLSDKPGSFDPEVVRQQLRALAVVNTVLTMQQGYSYSVSFKDFIRRYKFLAFDFDENVEETKNNCRLLLLRLKMEGWTMGKTKVFLKYYNKEYLSRLYETQIKKIVKVQSMMRAFVTRRKLFAKIRRYQVVADKNKCVAEERNDPAMESKAARIIQKRFREYAASKWELTDSQKDFIKPWCKRWKKKSIFQVLLLYRADRLQALVNFCLQIHLYNQNSLRDILKTKDRINITEVDEEAKPFQYLPPLQPTIPKLLFMWESLHLLGDINNCEPLPNSNVEKLEAEFYANLNKKKMEAKTQEENNRKNYEDKEIQTILIEEPPIHKKEEVSDSLTKLQPNNEKDEHPKQTAILKSEKNKTSVTNFNSEIDKKQLKPPENSTSTVENKKKINPIPRVPNPSKTSPPPIKPRRNSKTNVIPELQFQNPLNEMEEKFKNKNYNENGDDPPFNFRALLKKTNHSLAPQKSLHEVFQKEIETFSFTEKKKSLSCANFQHTSETTVAEIAPGILVYGKLADL